MLVTPTALPHSPHPQFQPSAVSYENIQTWPHLLRSTATRTRNVNANVRISGCTKCRAAVDEIFTRKSCAVSRVRVHTKRIRTTGAARARRRKTAGGFVRPMRRTNARVGNVLTQFPKCTHAFCAPGATFVWFVAARTKNRAPIGAL